MTDTSAISSRRAIVGALIGLGSHALVAVAAFVAGQVVRPSAGGGFEDLAAVSLVRWCTRLKPEEDSAKLRTPKPLALTRHG